jgi:hypothetical protein
MSTTEKRQPFWRKLYTGWLAIAGHFGEAQTLSLLGIIYVVMIGPVSLFLKRSDPLHKRALPAGESAWNAADTSAPDLERARRLF